MNYRSGVLFVFNCLLAVVTGTADAATTPIEQVIQLLDIQGGSQSGKTIKEGYYIVAVAFSDDDNADKAYKLARLDALKQLSNSINGSVISGRSESVVQFNTLTKGRKEVISADQRFSEVVEEQFKGSLTAARVIKKGQYDDQYFVAMMIAQNDVAAMTLLKSDTDENNPSQIRSLVSNTDEVATAVQAKGVASLKSGTRLAREEAIGDAIRNAVQQAKGVLVSGRAGTFNGALSTALSTKTQGYVRSYDIVEETKQRGEYIITINALVDKGQLLEDVNFYLDIFNSPKFAIDSTDQQAVIWLRPQLEGMGFKLTEDHRAASHVFRFRQTQSKALPHGKVTAYKTRMSLTLVEIKTGDIMLTITNDENKTIYRIAPEASARQASIRAAYKRLEKKLAKEIITSLADAAERGLVYPITIANANRKDLNLFRHILENGSTGTIERWEWDENGKEMTLYYRYAGSFSKAIDTFLEPLYQTYKTQGKGRRPKAITLHADYAKFRILK